MRAIAAARKALRDDELDLQRRKRDAAEAEQAVRHWQEEWASLLGCCWLGEAGTERSPAEVREILQALSELPALIEKHDDLGRRIRSISNDRARFVATVRALNGEAGLEFEEENVLEVADDLRHRLADARQQAKLQDSKKADLERAKTRLREARQAMAEIDGRRSEMGALFAVDTLTHHPHMRDIARKVRGKDVQVHELPALTIGTLEGAVAAGGCMRQAALGSRTISGGEFTRGIALKILVVLGG